MQPTALPLQTPPDPGTLLVWVPAVALLFLVAVASIERRTQRELVEAGEIDVEIVRGRAWSMLFAAGLLLATFALGLVAVMLVVARVPFDPLAERTAWVVGPLLSLGLALAFVWWLGRPVELTPLAEQTDEEVRRESDATAETTANAPGRQDAHRDPDAPRSE